MEILEENLAVRKRVESAWKDIESGNYKRMSGESFLKEIRSLK